MASLYELLCHQLLMNNDPLLEQLISYLPTRFPLQFYDSIAYGISGNEFVRSIGSSVSAVYSDDSTYFFLKPFFSFFFLMQLQDFLPRRRAPHETRRPLAVNEHRPERGLRCPTVLQNRRTRRAAPTAPAF